MEKYGFSVVAATSVTQRFSTAGQQRVLLGLGEPVHLVDEQHRLAAGHPALAARLLDDRADVLDAGVDRRELGERPAGRRGHQVGQRRLAGAGRPPEDHRRRPGHPALALDQPAQRRAGDQQVLLADDLVEGARPHPHGQRLVGRPSCVGRVLEQVHGADRNCSG